MDVYTHFQHTFMFKQLEKWNSYPMKVLFIIIISRIKFVIIAMI